MDELKTRRRIKTNLASNMAIMACGWFVAPPHNDKFQPRLGTNRIAPPLVCGEEYLPALKAALEGATSSIYIAIWGFDPHLDLALGDHHSWDHRNTLGELLIKKAGQGVDVRLLLFHTGLVDQFEDNAPGISSVLGFASVNDKPLENLSQDDYREQWFARVAEGRFDNLQLLLRDGTSGDISRENKQQTQKRRAALGNDYSETTVAEPSLTDHQKMILIDHILPDQALGFVQGFNLLPDYFDELEHPYHSTRRQGKKLIQDIGVKIQGAVLVDLYHNFKQSWDENLSGNAGAIDKPPPVLDELKQRYRGPDHTQIIRTWPKTEEFTIERFYQSAMMRVDYLYVEDQYFRSPELTQWILDRAKVLKALGSPKAIHLFVVTNSIDQAARFDSLGESHSREEVMKALGRHDMTTIDSNDAEEWKEHIQDSAKMAAARRRMERNGVRLSIATLKSYEGSAGKRYKEIYIHSKLCIINDTIYTLGSANWNHRSMRADTELNIMVQNPDPARALRKKLWGLHFNYTLKESNDMKEMHEEWQEKLHLNDLLLAKSEAPLSRAFSYHESLTSLFNLG